VPPASVHAPRLSPDCQAPAGTVTCGCSPLARAAPSRWVPRSRPSSGDRERERRPGVEVPDLRGVEAVPGRDLAGLEQVEDRGHGSPTAAGGHMAEGLAVVAALGVGPQVEALDDLGGLHRLARPHGGYPEPPAPGCARTPRRATRSVARFARRGLHRGPARRCT
jgi:hypothetical protein